MKLEVVDYGKLVMPSWVGREDIHKSHRLKLSWTERVFGKENLLNL